MRPACAILLRLSPPIVENGVCIHVRQHGCVVRGVSVSVPRHGSEQQERMEMRWIPFPSKVSSPVKHGTDAGCQQHAKLANPCFEAHMIMSAGTPLTCTVQPVHVYTCMSAHHACSQHAVNHP
eukprot:361100-Chlamydomonas_euryale.AAC.9